MILSKEFYDQCCPTYQKVIDELEQKIAELEEQKKQQKIAELKARDEQQKTVKLDAQNDEESTDDDYDDEISEFSYQIKAAILNFAENYLTPNEYWDFCIGEFFGFGDECSKQYCEITAIRYQHFYFDKELYRSQQGAGIYYKLLNFLHEKAYKYNKHYDERDICYPHSYLTQCFLRFEIHTLRLPSIEVLKRYEKMKLLYQKIKAAEKDVETWFKLLLEVEDYVFVMHNVEYRLGKNLLDVKLWTLYIEYLEQIGQFGELLKVYSKYCRFFLEDFDMLEKYKTAAAKYGPVVLHWPYHFYSEFDNEDCEMQIDEGDDKGEEYDEDVQIEADGFLDDEGEMQSVEEESMDTEDEYDEDVQIHNDEDYSIYENVDIQNSDVLPLDKQLFQNFYDTFQFQKFPFKEPLMNYILKNANHRLLRKVFESCKYFFYKRATPICYRLDAESSTKFVSESLTLSYSCNPDLYVKNTFITGCIDLEYTPNNGEMFMSKLIPRLSRCEAKYLYLHSQELTFNEFKFLVSHGQVVHYDMPFGCMKNENNGDVDLEKIMEYLPNIEKLHLPRVKCNSNTSHALSNQRFNGKISLFVVRFVSGEPFDPYEFLKFCVKNRDESFLLRMNFARHFNADFVKQFRKIMTDCIGFTNIHVR